jgi:hypothetical protein
MSLLLFKPPQVHLLRDSTGVLVTYHEIRQLSDKRVDSSPGAWRIDRLRHGRLHAGDGACLVRFRRALLVSAAKRSSPMRRRQRQIRAIEWRVLLEHVLAASAASAKAAAPARDL